MAEDPRGYGAEIAYLPAARLADAIARAELSATEVVNVFLERIRRYNGLLNAYILVLEDEARARAAHADAMLKAGCLTGALHGVPIAIKDLYDFKAGSPTTFGSKPFAQWVPQMSSTYIQRLEAAGAIVLGKTNTPEFGFRGTTDNLLFGATSTPFRIGKNSGGSSGGSASAVAAGLAAAALGSDGGGSIRIPAAWSGVYGFMPSFGRVASVVRPDAFALAKPFAVSAGPITRTVTDAALLLSVIAGPHDADPWSLPADNADYLRAASSLGTTRMRVAWTADFGCFPVEPDIVSVASGAVRALERAGATIEDVSIDLGFSHEELFQVWLRQSAVRLRHGLMDLRSEGIDVLSACRGELSSEVADLIELGGRISALTYRQDEVIRTRVYDALHGVLEQYDLIASPTVAVPPVDNTADGNTLGPTAVAGRPVNPLLGWCLTYLYNFTGHPVASVPAGLSPDGLPVGLQLAGRRHNDVSVIAASGLLERLRPWSGTYAQMDLWQRLAT